MSRNRKTLLILSAGIFVGGVAGWLYWKWVGCTSGSCPIWSDPYKSSAYAALLGLLLAWNFIPAKSKEEKK